MTTRRHYVRIEPDDAKHIELMLRIVEKICPRYWHNSALNLALYRIQKELKRVEKQLESEEKWT